MLKVRNDRGRIRLYDLIAAAIGVLLSFALVADLAGDKAFYNLRFNLGISDRGPIKEEIVRIVRQFDRMYVALFTSGGEYVNLNTMPAENILKRRIVQDVNLWISQDMILSHDRHAFNIVKVDIIRPDLATVETQENWVLLLRSRKTGKRMKSQKQNFIKVRYIVTNTDDRWKVQDFEVYSSDSIVPPLAEKRIIGE